MNDERALLSAISAAPLDDVVRLIYADWLEEHGYAAGEARAALIRRQLAPSRLEGGWCVDGKR